MAHNEVFCSSEVVIEYCPKPGDVVGFHTQILVDGQLSIPPEKPEIERILDTSIEVEVHKALTLSIQQPEGKKVLVAGTLHFGVEYIANVPSQKVHFAHFDLSFQALVRNTDGTLLPPEFNLADYNVYVCVEHVEVDPLDARSFLKEIALLIWLRPKNP